MRTIHLATDTGSTEPPAAGTAIADIDRCAERILEAVPRAMRGIRSEMRSGTEGLTVPQMRALLFVGRHPGASLGDLAAHLGVGPSTCSVLVDRLVRQGLVDRTTDPTERRRVRLDPTPSGARVVADGRERTRAWLRETLATMAPDDVAGLERAMALLEAATGTGVGATTNREPRPAAATAGASGVGPVGR